MNRADLLDVARDYVEGPGTLADLLDLLAAAPVEVAAPLAAAYLADPVGLDYLLAEFAETADIAEAAAVNNRATDYGRDLASAAADYAADRLAAALTTGATA